jgi:hypothetical protein
MQAYLLEAMTAKFALLEVVERADMSLPPHSSKH